MYKFLSKFLPTEQLTAIVDAYKKSNPDATELPTYISKTRLDEVISERDSAREQLKAVPSDWKSQIETLTKQVNDEKEAHKKTETEYEEKIKHIKAEAEIDGKLFKAKARNVTAVKALIDPSKPIDEEIARLQKDEAYLFGGKRMPKGTGGEGSGSGNDDDDEGHNISEDKRRAALGLPPTNSAQ